MIITSGFDAISEISIIEGLLTFIIVTRCVTTVAKTPPARYCQNSCTVRDITEIARMR